MSDITTDDPVNKDIAEARVIEELTFEEKVNELARFVQNEPLIREIDLKILAYCFDRRELSDIEDRIAGFPEFKAAPRDQYSLVTELVRHYGLEQYELNEAGDPVLESDKAGLSENEIDDLVVGLAFQTTEAGREVSDMLDPERRLHELLDMVPRRRDAYIEILDFFRDKHSFAEVDLLLSRQGTLQSEYGADGQQIQSSVLVDKLERAGGVFFDSGWQTTEAGAKLLDSIGSCAQGREG